MKEQDLAVKLWQYGDHKPNCAVNALVIMSGTAEYGKKNTCDCGWAELYNQLNQQFGGEAALTHKEGRHEV